MRRHVNPHGVRRALALAFVLIAVVACGGSSAPAAVPLGQEVVVDHAQLGGASPGPTTKLGITPLAVRTGTIAELEAGGFQIDDEDRGKTPVYVDVRYENKGTETIDRRLGVSLEDQDGNLISSVVIFDYGGDPYAPCPDKRDGALAPGDQFETCTLFLVGEGRHPTQVSFLPNVPGKATDFVYWAAK